MNEITVTKVEESIEGGGEGVDCWRVYSVDSEGHTNCHLIPKQTVAWRIAEYDLDPEDVQTAWDMILHERLIPQIPEDFPSPQLTQRHTALSRRDVHLAQVEAAKQNVGRINLPEKASSRARGAKVNNPHPLQVVLDRGVLKEELEVCRRLVKQARGEVPDPRWTVEVPIFVPLSGEEEEVVLEKGKTRISESSPE